MIYEDDKKIYNKVGVRTYSIYKDLLFAMCPGKWEVARTLIALVLANDIHCATTEGLSEACMLRKERETFYQIND